MALKKQVMELFFKAVVFFYCFLANKVILIHNSNQACKIEFQNYVQISKQLEILSHYEPATSRTTLMI